MLVQVNDSKVVAIQKYGELTVIPGNMETNTDAGCLNISENDYNPERNTIDVGDENYVAKMETTSKEHSRADEQWLQLLTSVN